MFLEVQERERATSDLLAAKKQNERKRWRIQSPNFIFVLPAPPQVLWAPSWRCLTLMLKTWKALAPGMEMLNTTCLLRFTRRWNTWLQQGNDPQTDPLWELDVKEIFLSMDRDKVYNALLKFHEILVQRQGKRGKELLFATNRFDRKLDKLGTRYGKYYTNLFFSEVFHAFCTYDIYQNDLFVFCIRVMLHQPIFFRSFSCFLCI